MLQGYPGVPTSKPALKILIQNFFVDLSGTNGSLLSIDVKYKIEGNVLFS